MHSTTILYLQFLITLKEVKDVRLFLQRMSKKSDANYGS